jgi:hypothetical protein
MVAQGPTPQLCSRGNGHQKAGKRPEPKIRWKVSPISGGTHAHDTLDLPERLTPNWEPGRPLYQAGFPHATPVTLPAVARL